MRILCISIFSIRTFAYLASNVYRSLYFKDITLSAYVFVLTKTYGAYPLHFLKSRSHLGNHGITLSYRTLSVIIYKLITIDEKVDEYHLKHRVLPFSIVPVLRRLNDAARVTALA